MPSPAAVQPMTNAQAIAAYGLKPTYGMVPPPSATSTNEAQPNDMGGAYALMAQIKSGKASS